MITQIVLQDILDKIQSTTTVHGGDLNHTVYLQQIRDAILGVSGLKPGSLHEIVYLQQIRNAILGVPDGQFGSLPAPIYLQQIVNAYSGVTAEAKGNLDEGVYLNEILNVATPSTPPTLTEQFLTTNPVFYLPLTESAGATLFEDAIDSADATINGCTAAAGVGVAGDNTWLFDGNNDRGQFGAPQLAALNSVFDGDTGTLVVFARAFQVANVAYRILFQIGADANNRIVAGRQDDNTTLFFQRFGQGNFSNISGAYGGTFTDWNLFSVTWDKTANEFKAYISNGVSVVQFGVTQVIALGFLGALAGTHTAIGAEGIAATIPWYGWLNHILYYNDVKDLAFLNNLGNLAGIFFFE